MNKERWKKIKPIVDRAMTIKNPKLRREYIKQACDESVLYQEVSELIDAIIKAEESGFMELK